MKMVRSFVMAKTKLLDLSSSVRYRNRARSRVSYGDEDDESVPTRFSSRAGAKVSYVESDEEVGKSDSKLGDVPADPYSNTPKV